jgi:type I restriction enzyme M protein
LKYVLLSNQIRERILTRKSGTTVYGIKASVLKEVEIPVPPLPTQHALVAELESERSLVDANRELIARFEKKMQAKLSEIWGESAATTK